MAICVDILGNHRNLVWIALINSGVENNFISQYIVQKIGLMPHRYTRVKTLDKHKLAVYSNHNIKYQITDTRGSRCHRTSFFVVIRFKGCNFVLG